MRSWYVLPDTELTLADRGTMGDENFFTRPWYALPDIELTLADRGTMGDENFCLDFISLSLSVYVFTGRGDGRLISPGKCFDPEILK